MPFGPAIPPPSEGCVRYQLRPVVADHHTGMPLSLVDMIRCPGDAVIGGRDAGAGRQAFPAEVIHHVQDPIAGTVA